MSSRRAPRAFTLIEVTIALAIALALSALTLPALGRWLRDGAFRESCRRVESGLEVCRAESVRRGVAVAALGRARADGSWVIELSPLDGQAEPDGDAGDIGSETTSQTGTGSARLPSVGGQGSVGLAGSASPVVRRVVAVLDPGMSFSPGVADSAGEAGHDSTHLSPVEIVLAVFLPDGSALAESGTALQDPHGAAAELRVNSWTGAATMTALSRAPGSTVAGHAGEDDSAVMPRTAPTAASTRNAGSTIQGGTR